MAEEKFDKMNTGRIIETLTSLNHRFSDKLDEKKMRLLDELSRRKLHSPALLRKYHESLCFMQAYPGNDKLLAVVDKELSEFSKRIESYRDLFGFDDTRLDDIGMVDTIIHYPYNFITARWLVRNFGDDVDIDWADYDEKESDPLSGLLGIFSLYVENDGIDDENIASESWIDEARGRKRNSLAWLLKKIDSIKAPFSVKQYIYDNAELLLQWNLGQRKAAATLAKKPSANIYYHKVDLVRAKIDLRKSPGKPVPDLRLLTAEKGDAVIDRLINALLPRHRELYPATFANPSEVYETVPGRGLQVYILGMRPDDRMPLESNYSALLIKNGVPIGYGISVLFFRRCEIAINVFDNFRSGEASIIFDHFLRLFYHHFGGRVFIMRRWQVGYENEEGLQSGSFWFYYKHGFRSMDKQVNRLAMAEMEKIKADPSYRSDLKTLKKLAVSDMYIDFRTKPAPPFKELQVTDIGIAITRMIAERFNGDGGRARNWARERALAALDSPDLSGWDKSLKLQFERWCPLIAMIPDLAGWDRSEKARLLEIIRAKGDIAEMAYIGLLQNHPLLESSLSRIAEKGAH